MARLLNAAQFPAGSMGPKVDAAVDFLNRSKNPAAEVVITSCERVADAMIGNTGTRVVRA